MWAALSGMGMGTPHALLLLGLQTLGELLASTFPIPRAHKNTLSGGEEGFMCKMGAMVPQLPGCSGCSHQLRDPAVGRGTDASAHHPSSSLSQSIPASLHMALGRSLFFNF